MKEATRDDQNLPSNSQVHSKSGDVGLWQSCWGHGGCRGGGWARGNQLSWHHIVVEVRAVGYWGGHREVAAWWSTVNDVVLASVGELQVEQWKRGKWNESCRLISWRTFQVSHTLGSPHALSICRPFENPNIGPQPSSWKGEHDVVLFVCVVKSESCKHINKEQWNVLTIHFSRCWGDR